jgi:hypothetical protein
MPARADDGSHPDREETLMDASPGQFAGDPAAATAFALTHRKSATAAFLIGLLLPGWGLVYAGTLGGAVLVWAGYIVGFVELGHAHAIGLLILLGAWAISAFGAASAAGDRNRAIMRAVLPAPPAGPPADPRVPTALARRGWDW